MANIELHIAALRILCQCMVTYVFRRAEHSRERYKTKQCTTEISLLKQQTTNQNATKSNQPNKTTDNKSNMYNNNHPNETTDNKSNHVQQQST